MVRLTKGNEAVVVGALYAGCDAFFGYPITPASEIAHAAADWFPAVGRVFVQAECETASISMVYGAGGEAVKEPAQIRAAMQRALEADGPYLLDLRIDKAFPTPVTPWRQAMREWEDDH